MLKTTKSAFVGFPRDRFTTLPEAADRLMATKVSATWAYTPGRPALDYDALFDGVRRSLLEVFAEHESPSVQASAWIMGRAILERHADVDEITMRLPNLHHWTVDLARFGLENPGEVFIATTEPVLVEVLNFFAEAGRRWRHEARETVESARQSEMVDVIPYLETPFDAGLALYAVRDDKGYSMTDCISMQTMRRLKNWHAILRFLDETDDIPLRGIALRSLAEQYEPVIVTGLIERLTKESKPPAFWPTSAPCVAPAIYTLPMPSYETPNASS